ncbi:ribonuclease E activity regulator RraA [Bacillus sp. 31A1R]|uniref:4-hydroxy-4-methyl-2-oxoglutarate aldolase n=1 Tax=Robertmurraya mangrovi TaxID=3098077 RepID=A0ABU5J3Q1_9BACI|nr:ribonuclease E activity regulator RraA [Bacillus sp. 31A1R]MDZ5474023.1 ribonuclease E activity regulator RraA [Bacillus sp. 31A1R]
MSFKTADLCDDFSNELQVLGSELQSFGKRTAFFGPICTVKVYEDNVLVKQALETIPTGSVLVVDGGGSRNCALMGDNLGDIAESRGLAGVIINGCVRDSAELALLDVGILALGTNPLKSKKGGKGEVNQVLSFLGIEWRPGDYIYADEDGVVVSPRKL